MINWKGEQLPEIYDGDIEININVKSLKGLPKILNGNLIINGNRYITDLNGLPEIINGKCVIAFTNNLKSLNGTLKKVKGTLKIVHTYLTSFEDSSIEEVENLIATNNKIKKLKGLPKITDKNLNLSNNEIYTLKDLDFEIFPKNKKITIILSTNNLTKLDKDFSKLKFNSFIVSKNRISSLKNFPKIVKRLDISENHFKKLIISDEYKIESLLCNNNEIKKIDITSLTNLKQLNISANRISNFKGIPKTIWGFFNASENPIKTLKGIPECYLDINLSSCQISSLNGIQKEVHGDLILSNNNLKTLKHAPKVVCGALSLEQNPISNLNNLPDVKETLNISFTKIKKIKNSQIPNELLTLNISYNPQLQEIELKDKKINTIIMEQIHPKKIKIELNEVKNLNLSYSTIDSFENFPKSVINLALIETKLKSFKNLSEIKRRMIYNVSHQTEKYYFDNADEESLKEDIKTILMLENFKKIRFSTSSFLFKKINEISSNLDIVLSLSKSERSELLDIALNQIDFNKIIKDFYDYINKRK